MSTINNNIRRPGIPAIDPSLPDDVKAILGPMKENIEIAMGLRSKGRAVGGAGYDGWDRRSVTLGMLVKLGVITEAQAKSVWQDL